MAAVATRTPRRSRSRHRDRRGTPDGMSASSARAKAKEAKEKELEKARLKKAQNASANKEREQQKKDFREQKREEEKKSIAQFLEQKARQRPPGDSLRIERQSEAEQRAEVAKAQAASEARAEARAKGRRKGKAPQVEVAEEQIRRLFALLDRNNQNQVSQRDVLMALKKHHPIRLLFGLVGSGEATALQQRLEKIQSAFEDGSGLGEVAPLFNALKGEANSFHFEAFLAQCRGDLQPHLQAAAESLRAHTQTQAFTPTKNWSVVPPGAACPAGLEFRMDMETGQTLARLPS